MARLWSHPDNAALRQRRKDPNVLLPGDEIEIPAPEAKSVKLAADQRHRFVCEKETVKLRLRLLRGKEVLRDEPYLLLVDGEELHGTTDGDGQLEHPIRARAGSATLRLLKRNEEFGLSLGGLSPHDTWPGVAQRLRNLGLFSGHAPSVEPAEGEQAPADLVDALKLFQRASSLDGSGELDSKTVDALKERYGG